jgi:hypothetical protein
MVEVEPISLVDRVRLLVADVQAAVKETEDRQGYRRENGRELGGPHKEACRELQGALQVLADRLGSLLAPPVDLGALRAEYEALRARLEE